MELWSKMIVWDHAPVTYKDFTGKIIICKKKDYAKRTIEYFPRVEFGEKMMSLRKFVDIAGGVKKSYRHLKINGLSWEKLKEKYFEVYSKETPEFIARREKFLKEIRSPEMDLHEQLMDELEWDDEPETDTEYLEIVKWIEDYCSERESLYNSIPREIYDECGKDPKWDPPPHLIYHGGEKLLEHIAYRIDRGHNS
jgi:hypothetical protein